MPASTFTFYQDFKEQLGKGVHDLSTHDIKVVLAAAANAPNVSTHDELADVTQISATGGYTAGAGGGYALSGESYTETSGTGTFTHTDPFVITASGGSVGPFRYLIYYNNTSTGDKLIGYLDYGSDITLADTETVSIDLPAGGLFTVA
jgi:hypothetical protein